MPAWLTVTAMLALASAGLCRLISNWFEFSDVQILLTFALVEAQSGRRV